MTDRRWFRPALPGLVALMVAGPAAAQVGHDPARSPYQDLRYSQFVSATAGYMFGSGGQIGVGPHHGTYFTLRHEFLADRPLSIGLLAGYAQLQRNVAVLEATNPDQRITGPVDDNVTFAEGWLQFNLAGGKTWHGLAPYASAGLGLAFAQKVPSDTSGYKLGTKFYLAPAVGVRVFVTRRLFVRLEARSIFWNLSYPSTYRTLDPDGFGPLQPLLAGRQLKEWSPVPVLHAGLGFAFHRPFF